MEGRLPETTPGHQRPLVYSIDKPSDSGGGGSAWRWVAIGCAGALVLACLCIVAAAGTFYFLDLRNATPTAPVTQRDATATAASPATPTRTVRPTPSPQHRNASVPSDWTWFDDPSGEVSLAVPSGWWYFFESETCCNVTLASFDPGSLPTGRIDWVPPGSGGTHEVPVGEIVVDLFRIAPPFADARPSFGRPPDGEDIVGGRYRAELYYGAPFTEWPHDQAITYLYQDDSGNEWCLVAYFGTPFDQDSDALATVATIVASIVHHGG
ncbi:MAG: hypothetical protein RMK01_12270 [Thermomicrobium sp.]|nr:hypothetical protein [Thermomicrobium sp.]